MSELVGPDYYQLLGVRRGADAREIRDAYVRLIKYAHPDLARLTDRPPSRLSELQRAYQCLQDSAARRAHDDQLKQLESDHAARLRRVQQRLRRADRHRLGQRRADSGAVSKPRLLWLVLAGTALIVGASAGAGWF